MVMVSLCRQEITTLYIITLQANFFTIFLLQDCGPSCWPAPFGMLLTVLIAVSMAVCIVITTFGNLLVIVSFAVDRQIRQPTNFFICSLAVTDVLIGTVSMPFYTVSIQCTQSPREQILKQIFSGLCANRLLARWTGSHTLWSLAFCWLHCVLGFSIHRCIFWWKYFLKFSNNVQCCSSQWIGFVLLNSQLATDPGEQEIRLKKRFFCCTKLFDSTIFEGDCDDCNLLDCAGSHLLHQHIWLGTLWRQAWSQPRRVHGPVSQGSSLQHLAHHRLLLVSSHCSLRSLQLHIWSSLDIIKEVKGKLEKM